MADTSIGASAETKEKFAEVTAGLGVAQADALKVVVDFYADHLDQTEGQMAAEAAVNLIKAQAAKLCDMVEGTARVAADELRVVREQAEEEKTGFNDKITELKASHADEVAGLKAELEGVKEDAEQLPGTLAEVSKLNTRLDAAEAGKAKAEEARDAAQTAENAAKAKLSDVQSDLTDALKDAAEARKEADQLKAELAEAVNAAKLDAKDAEGRIATLTAERDAARKETEAAKATVGYLEKQAEDLRAQIEELRGQVEDLRGQVTKSQN